MMLLPSSLTGVFAMTGLVLLLLLAAEPIAASTSTTTANAAATTRTKTSSSNEVSRRSTIRTSPYTSAKNRLQRQQQQQQHVVPVTHHQSGTPITGTSVPSRQNVGIDYDSIKKFAFDMAIVLKELRSEEYDPKIPSIFRRRRGVFHRNKNGPPSFTHTWTLEDWRRHTSRRRYVDYLLYFPQGQMLKRIFPQLAVLTAWSGIASWLCSKEVGLLDKFTLPLAPLSLVSTFVAALLTLRSNQGLSRLSEGRQAFGKVQLYTRELASLVTANIYPKDKQLGLKLLRHLSVFSWLLKNFLRSDVQNSLSDDILAVMLDPADAQFVKRHRKRPMAIVTRLRQVFALMAAKGQLHTAEELALDHMTTELDGCITSTERICASPIPPLYTAHTGRLLMFYLFFLPFALRGSNLLNVPGTILTTAVVGFAMLGLDEISHILEQPFKLMPLYQLSKNSMMDVGDVAVLEPPPLKPDEEEAHEQRATVEEGATPPYW